VFTPGPLAPAVIEHHGVRLGMLICYDLEFPENARRLARAGAELLAVPTALPEAPEAEVISGPMIRTRAFENQVFVAYAGLAGRDARFAYAGGSHIAAPDGATLARAGQGRARMPAEIEPAAFGASRARNPYLADLRAE
jgi:5-aminopentanamidase